MTRRLQGDVVCKTAAEFLDAISPRGKIFTDSTPSEWIYRGLSTQGHLLIPSALRPNGMLCDLTRVTGIKKKDLDDVSHQVLGEVKVLYRFFRQADSHGLRLPEDSQSLRVRLKMIQDTWDLDERGTWVEKHSLYGERDTSDHVGDLWPPSEFLSLMALAQHYGLPTRLLDWSRNAFTAAYFAAAGAIRRRRVRELTRKRASREYLVVWGLSVTRLEQCMDMNEMVLEENPVVVITAPAAGNPNLHAQEGLFTLYRSPLKLADPIDRRPLDRIIRGLYADSYERFTLDPETKPLFLRFRLPAGQSGELMRLLAKEGITAASLYPGFGGAAESVKEAQLWPDTVSRVATPTKRRKPTRKKAKRAP